MAKLILTDILDGISLALHAAYPTANIFSGSIEQGISPGDFNIINVVAEQEHKLGVRYSQTAVFDVVYYGSSANVDAYTGIATDAMLILDSVATPAGDILHAKSMSSRIDTDEKALHIGITYDAQVFLPEEKVEMRTLKIEQEG